MKAKDKLLEAVLRLEHYVGGKQRFWWITRFVSWLWGLPYDLRHGVETRRRVPSYDSERQSFESVVPWNLIPVLRPSSITESDVFLDVGSGKGRALLIAAARYPFGRVIGVEMSEALHQAAVENVRRYRGGSLRPIELVNGDALDYDVPQDVTVVFLNNPFSGSVFEGFMSNLRRSLDESPRPFQLVYGFPYMHQMVIDAGFTQIRKLGRVRVYS
jgi:SAM-dependent methyltransferase